MKTELKNIAELQSGVYLKAATNAVDKAYLLGIKDFDDDLNLIEPSAVVERNQVKDKYVIQKDHILFSTRLVFKAFRLPESKQTYVASNSFILIKPNTESVLPGYLRWFLNHSNTQHRLKHFAQGSSRMLYIKQKKLGSLNIALPEMSVQKNIARMDDLVRKEQIVRQKLANKREKYLQTFLLNTVSNE